MEKETKITAPEGCEIEKVELIDGVAVVTFKEKERKLPKSWEEFEKMNPIKVDYVTYNSDEIAYEKQVAKRYLTSLLSYRANAEAVLSLCQLIQLRDCYNGDWVPKWDDGDEAKHTIEFRRGKLDTGIALKLSSSPLYFKTKELRDKFLRYFRDLIVKIKPLYGIKKGGAE